MEHILISSSTSFLWKQIIYIEPTVNISCVVAKAFVGCSTTPQRVFASGNIIKLNKYHTMLTHYRLLTIVMPQVLQELIDSPVNTILKQLCTKFLTEMMLTINLCIFIIRHYRQVLLIQVCCSLCGFFYFLFVNHYNSPLLQIHRSLFDTRYLP